MAGSVEPISSFSEEVQLALLLSAPNLRPVEVDELRRLAMAPLDWNKVIGILILHRTASQAWSNLVHYELSTHGKFRPTAALSVLHTIFRSQQIKTQDQIACNVELIRRLDEAGILCAIMKGTAVARMGYRHLGARIFSDNDFLFNRRDIPAVGELLKELGYIQGSWNSASGKIRPATRSEIILHPLTSHETFPYVRMTPEAVMLESHHVDVHFSVDLLTSNRNDDTVRDLLARRICVKGNESGHLWALNQHDMFVFLCVHFQREACNRREVEELIDYMLYKLVDLLVLMDNTEFPIDLSEVARRAREQGFEREVFFALAYLHTLYPDRLGDETLRAVQPEGSTEFLHELTYNGEPFHRWRDPITERFFNPRRVAELPDGQGMGQD
jgi:hypothetical protein